MCRHRYTGQLVFYVCLILGIYLTLYQVLRKPTLSACRLKIFQDTSVPPFRHVALHGSWYNAYICIDFHLEDIGKDISYTVVTDLNFIWPNFVFTYVFWIYIRINADSVIKSCAYIIMYDLTSVPTNVRINGRITDLDLYGRIIDRSPFYVIPVLTI